MKTTTAIEERLKILKTDARAKAKADADAARKAADGRLRARAASDVFLADATARDARANAADDACRAAEPIMVTVAKGRVRVTANLTARDPVVRQTAAHAVAVAVNRMQRWSDALVGDARATAMTGQRQALASTPDEIASFLADEVRAAIKQGSVSIVVLPEPKRKSR